jgi:outer membrane protein OmpA-like peptidoglycan-associated protein
MKAIKSILGVLACATLLTVSFNAYAQENNNRDANGKVVRGAYETNGLWDNWFIGVGAGVNSVYNNADFGKYGIATDVNLGKWFTPSVGARIGWRGLTNEAKKTEAGTLSDGKFNAFDFFHGDLMWNISNAFSGYKETRVWDIIPYAQFGGYYFKNNDTDFDGTELGFGAGILNDFRLGGHVDAFVDLSLVASREGGYYNKGGKFISFPSATAGLIFNLGKTGFQRHSSIVPVVVPVPFTTDQYNALKNKCAALEKENAALKDKIAQLEAQKPDTVYAASEASKVVTPATLYFNIGETKLASRELAHLDYYAQNVLANSDQKITVTGYADKQTGTAKRNQYLSDQRAKYVKNLLVKKYGVSEDNITVKGEGASNSPFKSASLNRVVVIK